MSSGGRSSSAAHFDTNYTSATAGAAEEEFYGIVLNNDVSTVTTTEKYQLGAFIAFLILYQLQHHGRKAKQGGSSYMQTDLLVWLGMIGASIAFLQNTVLIPLLTTVIYTRTSYPYLVVIPHCIASAAAYRTLRENDRKKSNKEKDSTVTSQPVHYVTSFGMTFLCYGFGGSVVSDVFMGLPATALGHARILPCYILGYILIWFSPNDIIYTATTAQNSIFQWFVLVMEAIDGVTTPMGRVSRSARELKNKTTAPVVAGILAGCGGAILRYTERSIIQPKGSVDSSQIMSSFISLEAAVWRSLGYSLIWWYIAVYRCDAGIVFDTPEDDTHHCEEHNGSDFIRLVMVGFHVIWTITCQLGLTSGHPIVWTVRFLSENVLTTLVRVFHLGPQQAAYNDGLESLLLLQDDDDNDKATSSNNNTFGKRPKMSKSKSKKSKRSKKRD